MIKPIQHFKNLLRIFLRIIIFLGYPLRPELIESAMYLYKATRDPFLLSLGEDMLNSIEYSAKTPCGYATVKDVRDHTLEDRMESFFLSETTKYMYLLFDVDNDIIHNKQNEHVVKTSFGECVVESGGWIFNTEAHPIGNIKYINISNIYKIKSSGLNGIIIVIINAIWKNFGYVRQNFVLITFLLNNNFVAQIVFEIIDIWFM